LCQYKSCERDVQQASSAEAMPVKLELTTVEKMNNVAMVGW